MKPATPAARKLLAKLQALAERGINGERDAAAAKLARLKSRFDWTAPDPQGPDLFAGAFTPSPYSVPVGHVTDCDIQSAIKWAIENRTGISCRMAGAQILAQATPGTARTLETIVATVAGAFAALWQTYRQGGGLEPDRNCFMLGLYDGMMNETRAAGRLLPRRATVKPEKVTRSRKPCPIARGGISQHPYTVAAALGQRVRFCVPLAEVKHELETLLRPELAGAEQKGQ